MTLAAALSDLKAALTALKPTGEDGFEGLLAVLFSQITGERFRLASSGLQLGKDGATASGDTQIAFEAKLYTGAINKDQVLSKIASIIGSITPPDLWILGATIEANTQLVTAIESAADPNGLSTLILDWSSRTTLPPLAVACALAPKITIDFLSYKIADGSLLAKAASALETICTSPDFDTAARPIRQALHAPTLGMALAQRGNRRWLQAVLSDRAFSKATFGQVLAPGAEGKMPIRPRPNLAHALEEALRPSDMASLIAIVGAEGCGKSWLFGRAWLDGKTPDLAILLSATDLPKRITPVQFEAQLISQFITQSGDHESDRTRDRWARRFKRWKESSTTELRFVVCIDGLNQQPDTSWSQVLEGAAGVISRLGGRLVVTARESYFSNHVRSRMLCAITTILVPEWSPEELEDTFAALAIDLSGVKEEVRHRLANPRLLGVALELLAAGHINDLRELSVGRLLFEHIRSSTRERASLAAPEVFAKHLVDHAKELLERIQRQARQNPMVFEASGDDPLSAKLVAVTGEHFFRPLPDELTLYALTEEGLDLALGLAIIRALKSAAREGRAIADALRELLEPVAALDKVAAAMSAAVVVACVDERCDDGLCEVLMTEYLGLQNLDVDDYPAFAAAVRQRLASSLASTASIAVAPQRVAHSEWLIEALRDLRTEPTVWAKMAETIVAWLSTYSLDPRLGVFAPRSEPARQAEELADRRDRLDVRWRELTSAERVFIDTNMCRRDDLPPGELRHVAFRLLAGMALAPFATAFVSCSLSEALNSDRSAAYDDLVALLRFNRRDWTETHRALSSASDLLRTPGASTTAGWALVALLRGLATDAASDEEVALVDWLTRDRNHWTGWRLVEKYCDTDPCDPQSPAPTNIDDTVAKLREIDLAGVRTRVETGEADHFIGDTRPGLARFRLADAVSSHRNLLRAFLRAEGRGLFLGLSSFREHAPLIEPAEVDALLALARRHGEADPQQGAEEKDLWIGSQIALQLAMSRLDGSAQARALTSFPTLGSVLLDTVDLFQPADTATLEGLLEHAIDNGQPTGKLAALGFAVAASPTSTPRLLALTRDLSRDENSVVRSEAYRLIGILGDEVSMQGLVDRSWSAKDSTTKDLFFESWYGSALLVKAAERGLLAPVETVRRISAEHYGYAAARLGQEALPPVAAALAHSIEAALGVSIALPTEGVSTDLTTLARRPPFLSIVEQPAELDEQMKRINESPPEFAARQRRAWDQHRALAKQLDTSDARQIVERPSRTAIRLCVDGLAGWGRAVADAILQAPEPRRANVYNFGLLLAEALFVEDPDLATTLMQALLDRPGYLRITHGRGELSLETLCVWQANDNGRWSALRDNRLDAARNDWQLAQEVFAAGFCGRSDHLLDYARRCLAAPEPVQVARGLMVLGFGLRSAEAETALAAHASAGTFLGQAAEAARYAYQRNLWAEHWWRTMNDAPSDEAFWQASVLFLKIVDSRYQAWTDMPISSARCDTMLTMCKNALERRLKTWRRHRESTLFGQKLPPSYIAEATLRRPNDLAL